MARKIVKIHSHPGCLSGEQDGIEFSDGTFLVDTHFQDCCECVYADWGHLKDEAGIYDIDFTNLHISRVTYGICIGGVGRSFFVPCYNQQNGYYNDELDIYLIRPINHKKKPYEILDKWTKVPTKEEIC